MHKENMAPQRIPCPEPCFTMWTLRQGGMTIQSVSFQCKRIHSLMVTKHTGKWICQIFGMFVPMLFQILRIVKLVSTKIASA